MGTKRVKHGGRVKGTPNKATALAREAIANFVDGNAWRLQEWLDQIAETEGPLMAAKLFIDLIEYHVPKLSRSELSGADGQPMQFRVITELVRPKPVDD